MPSKVLSTQNPIPFFFTFPVSELCKSTYTQRGRWGRVGEGGQLSWSGRRGCGRSAHPARGAGDPGFSVGSSPELHARGSSPLARGLLRVSRNLLPRLPKGRYHGGWGGGCMKVSLFPRLLILGAG